MSVASLAQVQRPSGPSQRITLCSCSLFALLAFRNRIDTSRQLPIRSRYAIQARVIVVSARTRPANLTLSLSPLSHRANSSSSRQPLEFPPHHTPGSLCAALRAVASVMAASDPPRRRLSPGTHAPDLRHKSFHQNGLPKSSPDDPASLKNVLKIY